MINQLLNLNFNIVNQKKIVDEISQILMLDGDFNINETQIEFDYLSSLILIEFLDKNFQISVTRDEIKNFNVIKDILDFIHKSKI